MAFPWDGSYNDYTVGMGIEVGVLACYITVNDFSAHSNKNHSYPYTTIRVFLIYSFSVGIGMGGNRDYCSGINGNRKRFPKAGNGNGNEGMGMGGNGYTKVIPAHLYYVPTVVCPVVLMSVPR